MAVVAPKTDVRSSKLVVLVKYNSGVPMEEAITRGKDASVNVASNQRMSRALVGSEEWRGVSEGLPCWTSTMTAYEKPDQKLGKTIEYVDPETNLRYVFRVSDEHLGKKNVVLVAEQRDYSLEVDGTNRIIQATASDAIERFPASDGWYRGDAKHDIPQGSVIDSSNDDARYLWRIEKRVGLAARDFCGGRRDVGLYVLPSFRLGVVGEEATEGGAPQNSNGTTPFRTAPDVMIPATLVAELRSLCGTSQEEVSDVAGALKLLKSGASLEATKRVLEILEEVLKG